MKLVCEIILVFSITEAKILAKKKRKLVFVLKFVSSLVGEGGNFIVKETD